MPDRELAPPALTERYLGELRDSIYLASGQDRMTTWLLNSVGQRVAAIVPADVAEGSLAEAMVAARKARQEASETLTQAAVLLTRVAQSIAAGPT